MAKNITGENNKIVLFDDAGNPAKIVRTNINWSAQSAFMAERTVNS